MVHISDGILSLPVLAAGWAITIVLLAVAIWWSKKKGNLEEEIPKLSVMTAAFFVASLIHIPVGPTSAHFILNGLVGVILGIFAFPAIFIGVVLQTVLFQHGGITTIGVNTANMGISALIAYCIFKWGNKVGMTLMKKELSVWIFGALAGGVGVFLAVIFTAFSLVLSNEEAFFAIAIAFTVTHIPIIIMEAIITGSIAVFLLKVKPELLGGLGDGD
ncbi:MAG: cobalt transporter CbiM [Euryarchaeota archaeon]|nr:cobalt transporter CbiM [Euryarchaeota archaeon]